MEGTLIDSIDHVVLTTRDEVKWIEFYTETLGMRLERYGDNRSALGFGRQKINVHQPGVTAGLKAQSPTSGSLDLCFIASAPLDDVIASLRGGGVRIIPGPVQRAGAHGPSVQYMSAILTTILSRLPSTCPDAATAAARDNPRPCGPLLSQWVQTMNPTASLSRRCSGSCEPRERSIL